MTTTPALFWLTPGNTVTDTTGDTFTIAGLRTRPNGSIVVELAIDGVDGVIGYARPHELTPTDTDDEPTPPAA